MKPCAKSQRIMKKLGVVFNDSSRRSESVQYWIDELPCLAFYFHPDRYIHMNMTHSHCVNRQAVFFHELGHALDYCLHDLPGLASLEFCKERNLRELIANAFAIRLGRVPSLSKEYQKNCSFACSDVLSAKDILEAVRRYRNIVRYWENA